MEESDMMAGNDRSKCRKSSRENAPNRSKLTGAFLPVECNILKMNLPKSLEPSEIEVLNDWMPRNQTYLLAVSGGRDSMVLWHLLKRAGYENLVVCHVNHLLRGAASDSDEAFVKTEAGRREDDFRATRIDIDTKADEEGISLELAAREARYAWFATLANELSCPRVILGHHADDQVETVIMNFFRGAGGRGLSGMTALSERNEGWGKMQLFRPLLGIFREEIDQYASQNRILFCEDESNRENFALRNRVRHRLMPELEKVFRRDVRQAVLRGAELARQNETWIEEEMATHAESANGATLDVKWLRTLAEPLRNRIILQWLRNGGVKDCGYSEVASVSEIAMSSGRPAKVNLPGNIFARRREGILFLEEGDSK